MKVAEPASGSGGAFLAAKWLSGLGAGLLGAAIIASLDPPKTRRELFLQAATAGIGSIIFGPMAVRLLDFYVDAVDLKDLHGTLDYFEWTVPVYFVVGALSWGMFGAIVKLRRLIAERAAEKIIDKV